MKRYMVGSFGAARVGYNFRPDWDKSLQQPWFGRWWIWLGPWVIGNLNTWDAS